MAQEHGDRDDEASRGDSDQLAEVNHTGLAGREPLGDRSGLLGHFRSPSTAGLAGPEPPNNSGLAGGPGASDRSGLLGSTGAPDQEERREE